MPSPERLDVEESAWRLFTGKIRRSGMRRYGSLLAAFLVAMLIALPASAQVAVDDNFTVESGSSNNRLDVLANDSISGGFGFILSVTQPSQGGQVTFDGNRRNVIYTPPSGFSGTETFGYTIWSGGFFSAQVTVQVIGDNAKPKAEDDRYETGLNARLDVGAAAGILANDSDPDGDPLTVTLTEDVDDGTLTLRPDGSFTYIPRAGFTGEDEFRYQAADGRGGTDNARVRIRVADAGESPVVAAIPSQTAYIGTPFELDLTAFVTDADTPSSDLRFAALSSFPPDLTISPLGLISGTPAGGTAATYTIRFSVTDGANTTNGSFTLVIENEPAVDLVVTLDVEPNPVAVGAAARWVLNVTNTSGFTAGTVSVAGRFAGSTSFEFDGTTPANCTLVPEPPDVAVDCTIDVLPGGASATIELAGSGPAAGDVLGTFSAESQLRDEADPSDNSAETTISIAEQITREGAQAIGGFTITAIDAGDLNGDGFADIAAATGDADSVLVFLNVPDPANERKRLITETPLEIGSAGNDDAIAVADLDADGDLDIVVAGPAGRAVRIYLNTGNAEFDAEAAFTPSIGIRAIATGDVDGDGFIDLVLAGSSGNLLSRGTGVPGDFASPVAFGTGTAVDVAVVNLFGDSLPELVFAKSDGDATIFRYDGSAAVAAATLPSGPATSVTATDFSGDGAIDLLFGRDRTSGSFATPANPLFVNYSTSAPDFVEANGRLGAAPTFTVLASDTDDDTYTDAIVLNKSGAHQVFKNTGVGDGTFELAPGQLAAANSRVATSARLSADGRLDLAIAGPDGISIYLADGLGGFGLGDVTPPTLTLVGDAPFSLRVGSAWVDPGATATDLADGDLSDTVIVSGEVDTALIGSYVVTYEVWDDSGNGATATRTVQVTPREAVGGGGGGALSVTVVLLLLTLSLIARFKSEDEDN